MEIRWSLPAVEDLERICAGIEQDNPEARRVANVIYDGCARLRDFPNMGRASRRMRGRRGADMGMWLVLCGVGRWRGL